MKFCSIKKRNSFKGKKVSDFCRMKRFSRKFFRRRMNFSAKDEIIVNPKDPLNILELEKQQNQRISMGLSPLPGDSAFNTPNIESESYSLESVNVNTYKRPSNDALRINYRKFPIVFNGYFMKTKPEDRLKYFLPDWFDRSFVCDYGCHRGDFAFKLFEMYHSKIQRLDCIDVRKNCILNARHIQREKQRCEIIRQMKLKSCDLIDYSRICFKVSNWIKDSEIIAINDECEYDIIFALGVTKLIHLYYGDIGLEKFLRRACHRLKPGGHLIMELQSRSKYVEAVKEIGKPFIARNFKNLKFQPDKLEPLLASVGFPYCCRISTEKWNKTNQGDILLCTKPIGTTPVPIRDTNTTELMLKYSNYDNICCAAGATPNNPPPVIYNPRSTDFIVSIDDNLSIGGIERSCDEVDQLPDSTMTD